MDVILHRQTLICLQDDTLNMIQYVFFLSVVSTKVRVPQHPVVYHQVLGIDMLYHFEILPYFWTIPCNPYSDYSIAIPKIMPKVNKSNHGTSRLNTKSN